MSVANVLERLDTVILRARAENSRVGYFAVLYRLTTRAVQASLEAGRFEDPARLERFTHIFALRYLEALERFRRDDRIPACWGEALRATSNWRPVVVQHLLLAMNAHINYDLGMAAAQTAPGAALPGLRRDFEAVNDIFASLIDRVELSLAEIWPTLRFVDALGGRNDEAILAFSIRRARSAAWTAAERLAALDADAQALELRLIDGQTSALARKILTPGIKLTLALLLVRGQERGGVSSIMDLLERAPAVASYLRELQSR